MFFSDSSILTTFSQSSNNSSNESFYFCNDEDIYISIALLEADLSDFMIEWNLTNKQYKSIRPIKKDSKSRNEEFLKILNTMKGSKQIKGLILFSNFWETDLQLCEILAPFNFEYFIFSKDRNFNKFEIKDSPLEIKENFFMKAHQGYNKIFSRIEFLPENIMFEGFNFIVEKSQRENNLAKNDKKELKTRYRILKMFLADLEETIYLLKKFQFSFYNNHPMEFYEQCINSFEQFLLFKKEKNCSFGYFYENFFYIEFSKNY